MRYLLTSLVRLFPRSFREQFAVEMVEHIERDYDAARSRGHPALVWFILVTVVDLLTSAIAERVRPTWVRPPSIVMENHAMRSMFQEWARDLRLAMRSLGRSPGFTAVAVGTLGLAIGANAAMFGVVDAVLLRPLPYANADRLVYINSAAPGSQLPPEFGVTPEMYVQFRELSRTLEDVSTLNSFTNTLRVGDRVERVRMSWPTYTMFSTLGAKPMLGRLPVAEDEDRVAVISYALWTTWFGGDSSVVGRSYYVGGGQRQIIGVMGPRFKFPNDETLLWVSSVIRPEGITPGRFGPPLVGRMKPGVTPEQVARELTALSKRLPERFGGTPQYAKLIEQYRAVVRPLEEQMFGRVARPLWILLAAVTIVLVIACANVANLFMVRTEGRQRELAVRRAIGAARGQLIRLQMSEAVVIAALASLVATLLAWLGLRAFVGAAPAETPRIGDVNLDVNTLLFTAVAAIVSALACGLVPAIRASTPNLSRLRESGRGSTRRRQWGRDGLVVAQTALALVLLIGSGLLMRSFAKLSHVDPGYDTKDLFTFQIAPEGEHLNDGPSYARFSMDFMERLRALPGVQLVGLVENVPLNEGTFGGPYRTEEMSSDPNATTHLNFTWAAGDYFRAMGISVLEGEAFPSRDLQATIGKVVISKSAAQLLWPGKSAVGRRIKRRDMEGWETVIGVVEDVMQEDFRTKADPLVYHALVGPTPRAWAISSPAYVIKTTRAEVIAPEVRALVREIAPTAPMYRVFTMAGLARDSMVALSFTMLTLGIISTLALILGAVGLYGVLSYVVAQRTREIGVRMALGAEAGQVRRMVVAQGAQVVAIGVAIGIGVAILSTRALGSLLFGVPALDVATFVAMSGSMIAVGLLASYMPARRASRVDPMESLRGE